MLIAYREKLDRSLLGFMFLQYTRTLSHSHVLYEILMKSVDQDQSAQTWTIIPIHLKLDNTDYVIAFVNSDRNGLK